MSKRDAKFGVAWTLGRWHYLERLGWIAVRKNRRATGVSVRMGRHSIGWGGGPW